MKSGWITLHIKDDLKSSLFWPLGGDTILMQCRSPALWLTVYGLLILIIGLPWSACLVFVSLLFASIPIFSRDVRSISRQHARAPRHIGISFWHRTRASRTIIKIAGGREASIWPTVRQNPTSCTLRYSILGRGSVVRLYQIVIFVWPVTVFAIPC